jgi:DNA invertase Pin-like site-specific DNA recombinase
MSANVSKLKPKQEDAIIALLTNRTLEAARAVNITPQTLYRWQQEPEFASSPGLRQCSRRFRHRCR